MNAKGKALARSVLEKLLQKAERAWAQQVEREHSILFSEASLSDYFQLPMRADKDVAHAELREAERAGAIALEWDRRAGTDGQIVRARLTDADAVARLLGRQSAWQLFDQATDQLTPWIATGNVGAILARWRAGKSVRNMSAVDVQEVADACRVVDACRDLSKTNDIPIRRLSGQLFADSKRIEAIGAALDAVTGESLDPPWRDIEDVLSSLGLVKMPQPLLIAGDGAVELVDGTILKIPAPYVGLSPTSIRHLVLGSGARYVLTVENLTTFHELALGRAGKPEGLILYTAGMPSPAFLNVYAKSIDRMLSDAGVFRYHWSDIDLGGLRIAAQIARAHASMLHLWNMDPTEFPGAVTRKQLSGEEVREILRISEQYGWAETGRRICAELRAIEQEVLPLSLP